jgi:polysaccharide chain length determinant protein (PEP-CTERM system associated)
MSRARLGDLIVRLDLYPNLKKKKVPFDEIIEQMRRDVDLELKGVDPQMSGRTPTIAFAISYSGRDPQTVARVANVIASSYVAENTKTRAGQAVRTAEFLKTQLAEVKQGLDGQERLASDFKLSHMGELPQQVEANLASLERLNTQLRLNGENQIRAMDRRDRLEKQLADAADGSSAPITPAPTSSPRAAQLTKLRQELSELRRHFTDEYPDVVRVRTEIAALEPQVSERPAPASAPAPFSDPKARLTREIGEIGAELKALKDEELVLRKAIASHEARVENVPKRQEEFRALSRDYDTTKERYDTLRKRYEEAQLAENLEQGQKIEQFRILDPAISPREPAAPGRLRLLIGGFFLAIGLAVGAIMAAERYDTSFHSMDDLKSFVSVPALFNIPKILTAADTRRRWRRFALTTASVVVGLLVIVTGLHYVARGNEQIVRFMARGHL